MSHDILHSSNLLLFTVRNVVWEGLPKLSVAEEHFHCEFVGVDPGLWKQLLFIRHLYTSARVFDASGTLDYDVPCGSYMPAKTLGCPVRKPSKPA